jgi:hypothetical protein
VLELRKPFFRFVFIREIRGLFTQPQKSQSQLHFAARPECRRAARNKRITIYARAMITGGLERSDKIPKLLTFAARPECRRAARNKRKTD